MCREVWILQGNEFISDTVSIESKVTAYKSQFTFFRLKQLRVVSRFLILCQGKVRKVHSLQLYLPETE